MKRKPPGWPKYMEAKPLAGGIRYFWNAPTRARKRSCPIKSEALGIDYAAAKARCDDYLNPLFNSWLTGGDSDAKRRAPVGSFDWLVADYKSNKKYTKRPPRTRSSYDRALEDAAGFTLTDGRRFGVLNVNSVKAATVDKLYERLKVGPGTTRTAKPRKLPFRCSMSMARHCFPRWWRALRELSRPAR